MKNIATALKALRERIRAAERRYGRIEGSVRLLAVGKTRNSAEIRTAAGCDQIEFGENYLQEAMAKMEECADLGLTWHFIGPIQSNKTRQIAEHFDWTHSVDRERIARRLDAARPSVEGPLNVCLQVNISAENSKSGTPPEAVTDLAEAVSNLPNLRLRGLMTLPAFTTDFENQRRPFRRLRRMLEELQARGYDMDTLSMGTTGDMEAAIAEGATIVRVGTALFGPRET